MVRMGAGPPDARIMLVGEAYGETEDKSGIPFSGASGQELNRMLSDAGILRAECYCTNVVNARPLYNDITKWIPEDKKSITGKMVERQGKWVDPIVAEGLTMLDKEISLVQPQVIVALGGTALWALTGHESIVKWRGSLLDLQRPASPGRSPVAVGPEGSEDTGAAGGKDHDRVVRVIPTYHPAAVLRMFEWRPVSVLDLKRACRELRNGPTPVPNWRFVIRPSFQVVLDTIAFLQAKVEEEPTWIDLDLETKVGHIACCGLSWSRTEGICIPFMTQTDNAGYWLLEEEAWILGLLFRLLTHRNCWVRGQNLLYDCQYIYRRWGFFPNVKQDTMISQHVLWAGLPKSLAFQASMYADYYQNWKPEKETWKEGG